jgi:hypothetical protein
MCNTTVYSFIFTKQRYILRISDRPLILLIFQINIIFISLFYLLNNNLQYPFGTIDLDLKGYKNVVKILRYLPTKTNSGLLIKINLQIKDNIIFKTFQLIEFF